MLTPSAETQNALPLQSQKVRQRRGQWVSRDHAWGRAILRTATTCGNIVPSRKVVKVRSIFLDTTPVDMRSLIRAIYFKEARTPLSVTDFLHYNATLGLLLDGCNNLEDIVINAPRNSGEPTARLMTLLPMIPGLALKTDYAKKRCLPTVAARTPFSKSCPQLADSVAVPSSQSWGEFGYSDPDLAGQSCSAHG